MGEVRRNDYLVRFRADDAEFVVFKDGRALIKGGRQRSASPVDLREVHRRLKQTADERRPRMHRDTECPLLFKGRGYG